MLVSSDWLISVAQIDAGVVIEPKSGLWPRNDFQLIISGKVNQKSVRHGLYIVDACVDKNALVPFMGAGLNVRGVSHAAFSTKGRHHTTEPLCPVTGTELLSS